MGRCDARERVELLVAIPVDRLRFLQLLLLLLHAQARLPHHFVTLFVHEQLALDAFESLPPEAPDPILAERAKGPLRSNRRRTVTVCHLSEDDARPPVAPPERAAPRDENSRGEAFSFLVSFHISLNARLATPGSRIDPEARRSCRTRDTSAAMSACRRGSATSPRQLGVAKCAQETADKLVSLS